MKGLNLAIDSDLGSVCLVGIAVDRTYINIRIPEDRLAELEGEADDAILGVSCAWAEKLS